MDSRPYIKHKLNRITHEIGQTHIISWILTNVINPLKLGRIEMSPKNKQKYLKGDYNIELLEDLHDVFITLH